MIGKTNSGKLKVQVDTKKAKIEYDKDSFVNEESPIVEKFVLRKEPKLIENNS